MFEPTSEAAPAHDAASILFNLPDYRVVTAVEEPDGARHVLVETLTGEGACPGCGVLSWRVQARPISRVKDLPTGGGPVSVWVRKRRYRCAEAGCARRTFTEVTDQLGPRARVTTRLAAAVVTALQVEVRTVAGVAAAHGLDWCTVMRLLAATVTLPEQHPGRRRLVRVLGVDEHRFRRVRYVRDGDVVRRVEPWSVMITNAETGQILDVVDGPRGATIKAWLLAQPRWWRRRIQVVTIDMSAEFRAAITKTLPWAEIAADHWHVVRLANDMVTTVRRRRAWEATGHRGRRSDKPWRYRQLLLAAGDQLSVRQRERLREVLDADIELAVAWGIKEHVRQLLAARTLEVFHREWAALTRAVKATKLEEPRRLYKTLCAWRRPLLTFCRTRHTNARTEAANLTAKTFKRLGRGYRNHDNYRYRIMAYTAHRTAA